MGKRSAIQNRYIQGWVLVSFYGCWSVLAHAQLELPNIEATPQCAAKLLLLVRDTVPKVFEEGAEYDVNLLDFIDANRQLVGYLSRLDVYRELAQHRGPRLTLHVSLPKSVGKENEAPRLPETMAAQMASYQRIPLRDLQATLERLSYEIGHRRSQSLLTGIISLYAADRRAEVFRLATSREKLTALRQSPPPFEHFQTQFRFSDHGLLKDSFRSWDEVFLEVERWIQNEESLVAASGAYVVKEKGGEVSTDSIIERPQLLVETLKRKEILAQLKSILNLKDSKAGAAVTSEGSPDFTLVEVPPFYAAFRGLVGGDCSSSYCFAYSYLPAERTFFVYRGREELLGYLMLTELHYITQAGTPAPAWYLHDITGRRLSAKIANQLIHAVALAATQHNRKLLLPTAKMSSEANNHKELIQLLGQLVENQSQVAIHYPDISIRDTLASSGVPVDARYDTSVANRSAFEPKLSEEVLAGISVHLGTPEQFSQDASQRKLSPSDSALLALDILSSERDEMARTSLVEELHAIAAGGIHVEKVNYGPRQQAAQAIAGMAGTDFNRLLLLNAALSNPNQLPLDEYYQILREQFQAFGLDLGNLLLNHSYLFHEGHLRAPDRLTHLGMREDTLDHTLAILARWENPTLAYEVIGSAPEIFEASPKFHKLVRRFLSNPEHEQRLQGLKESGVRF